MAAPMRHREKCMRILIRESAILAGDATLKGTTVPKGTVIKNLARQATS
jgi:hypothetical protein